MMNNTLTAVPGIRVGHITDLEAITGCTVVICPPGTVGGVDQRGGAPGTRETDLLRPIHRVNEVTAVMLSGGSAFGLASAHGAVRYLEEHQLGYLSGLGFIVPIVPAAILMDLSLGRSDVRPDEAMGYAACEAATDSPVEQGCVGAGTGCIVGGLGGLERATKGGIGTAMVELGDGLVVAALMAVNAVGDVVDEDGRIIAGLRAENGDGFVSTLEVMREFAHMPEMPKRQRENTVIGVVATNAKLDNVAVNKVAQMANNGIARAVVPSHLMFDGDTVFALATGEKPANVNVIGAYATEVVAQAIRNAVRSATSLGGVRAVGE